MHRRDHCGGIQGGNHWGFRGTSLEVSGGSLRSQRDHGAGARHCPELHKGRLGGLRGREAEPGRARPAPSLPGPPWRPGPRAAPLRSRRRRSRPPSRSRRRCRRRRRSSPSSRSSTTSSNGNGGHGHRRPPPRRAPRPCRSRLLGRCCLTPELSGACVRSGAKGALAGGVLPVTASAGMPWIGTEAMGCPL